MGGGRRGGIVTWKERKRGEKERKRVGEMRGRREGRVKKETGRKEGVSE